MSDKITMKDYLDYFGNKSAEADSLVKNLMKDYTQGASSRITTAQQLKMFDDYIKGASERIDDQRFGTIRPKKTLMQKVMEDVNDPQMQMMMGFVEPGGGLKTLGKSVAKGGKNVVDILRELFGVGKKEMGDVLSGYKRGVQPDAPVIKPATEGQQALKLTAQEIPSLKAETLSKSEAKTLGQALDFQKSGQISTPAIPEAKGPTLKEALDKVLKQMDEAAEYSDHYRLDPEATLDTFMDMQPEDALELLRRAAGQKPQMSTWWDKAQEAKINFSDVDDIKELIRKFGKAKPYFKDRR